MDPMTHPWPDEESLNAKFGGVFDEALNPPPTGQRLVDEILVGARAMRASDQPVPERLEWWERDAAGQVFMSGRRRAACPWLRERSESLQLEGVVEHWRECVSCLAAFLAGRLTREQAAASLERHKLRAPPDLLELLPAAPGHR